jgi:septal ring factor EnvC (AmiA/AmiB activator)
MSGAPQVRLSWAEHFLNWFPRHTTLYFRRDKAEQEAERKGAIAVMKRHFAQVSPFFDAIDREHARLRAEVAEWKAKFADLHVAHGAIEQSLKQQDAEVEQLRRERDEARVDAEMYKERSQRLSALLAKSIENGLKEDL